MYIRHRCRRNSVMSNSKERLELGLIEHFHKNNKLCIEMTRQRKRGLGLLGAASCGKANIRGKPNEREESL